MPSRVGCSWRRSVQMHMHALLLLMGFSIYYINRKRWTTALLVHVETAHQGDLSEDDQIASGGITSTAAGGKSKYPLADGGTVLLRPAVVHIYTRGADPRTVGRDAHPGDAAIDGERQLLLCFPGDSKIWGSDTTPPTRLWTFLSSSQWNKIERCPRQLSTSRLA